SDRIRRGFDPQAFPVIEEQCVRIVFEAVPDAKFDKTFTLGANPAEDFSNDSVLVTLAIRFSAAGHQMPWIAVAGFGAESFQLGIQH
ncbi:MAG: hypothetical protein WD468_00185, partial [Pirellulales bacterium]